MSESCWLCAPTWAWAPCPIPLRARAASLAPGGEQSHRSSVDAVVKAFDSPLDEPVVNAVQRIAEARGASMAQVALAWVLKNPVVSAPIVGATKPHHLPDSIAALDLHLTDDEIRALEEPYTPHGPSWF